MSSKIYPDRYDKETRKAYNHAWKTINHARVLLNNARTRARIKGLPCTIEAVDIVIPEVCPALGVKLQRGKIHVSPCSPVLDRIIPKLGYVKSNIIVVSHRANNIKNDATPEEIIKVGEFYKTLLEGRKK